MAHPMSVHATDEGTPKEVDDEDDDDDDDNDDYNDEKIIGWGVLLSWERRGLKTMQLVCQSSAPS